MTGRELDELAQDAFCVLRLNRFFYALATAITATVPSSTSVAIVMISWKPHTAETSISTAGFFLFLLAFVEAHPGIFGLESCGTQLVQCAIVAQDLEREILGTKLTGLF